MMGDVSAVSTAVVDEVSEVEYMDHHLEEGRKVTCRPLADGRSVLFGTDADGDSFCISVTPSLSAAIRAALALADLPGGQARCPSP